MKEILDEIRGLGPDSRELRKFSWVVGGAFVVLWTVLAMLLPLWGRGGDYPALWWIGLGLATVGTLLPRAVSPLFYVWMSFAFVLGYFMTRIILTLFFFLVVTPFGVVFKIIGRDLLSRQLLPSAESYWLEKKYPIADRSRFEKFF